MSRYHGATPLHRVEPILLRVAAGGELGIPEDRLAPEDVRRLSGCGLIQVEQDLRDKVFMVVLSGKGRERLLRGAEPFLLDERRARGG